MQIRSVFVAGILALATIGVDAQPWVLTGNLNTVGTEYLGAAAGSTTNLHLQTIPQLSIDFSTQNSLRARLYPNDFTYLNGYTAPAPLHWQRGFFALSGRPTFFTNSDGPFSRLHLVDDVGVDYLDTYAQQLGWRPWMRNGVTFTGNEDQGYIGQKYVYGEPFVPIGDRSDMVLQWSNDYAGEDGPDRLRFLFTNEPGEVNGGPIASGARSTEGLEGMRLTPIDENNINVGVGDFFAGNLVDATNINEPTERLDVLTGRVRIRQLPTDPEATTETRYIVVDPTGVVRWRNLPATATPGCEWYSEPLPAFKEVRSGLGNVGTGGSCPDRGWLYTVGQTGTLGAKFNLYQNSNERNVQSGLGVAMVTKTGSASESFGIRAVVEPVGGEVSNAAHGVYGQVVEPGGGFGNGVFGRVTKTTSAPVIDMSGVSGSSELGPTGVATNLFGTLGHAQPKGTVGSSIGAMGKSSVNALSSTTPESCGVKGSSTSFAAAIGNSYGGYFSTGIQYNGSVTAGYGVFAESNGAGGSQTNSYGVNARGVNGSGENYGVRAYARGTTGSANYGIHAQTGWTVSGLNYAGYFEGNVHINGLASCTYNVWSSDETLKTDIADLTGSRELLAQLRPRNYSFRVDEFESMHLPSGLQRGVIAQELEQVMPELVREVNLAPVLDENGAEIEAARTIKGVNYIGLIPVLIGAAQEQQASIDGIEANSAAQADELGSLRSAFEAQSARLDQLEQLLTECCNRSAPNALQEGGLNGIPNLNDSDGDRKLRIQPNPFSESTTVYYTLERGGRAQLMANSADGKQLRVLHEANLESGDYQYNWNTADLASGIYYVTLLLDGQPVVKKAVKVNR